MVPGLAGCWTRSTNAFTFTGRAAASNVLKIPTSSAVRMSCPGSNSISRKFSPRHSNWKNRDELALILLPDCGNPENCPRQNQNDGNSKHRENQSHKRLSWNCRPRAKTQWETSIGNDTAIQPCGNR